MKVSSYEGFPYTCEETKTVNWYKTVKIAFPYHTERCPLCHHTFDIDLLWEKHPDHNFFNKQDKPMSQEEFKQHPELLLRENAEQNVTCPTCGNSWASLFEKSYDDPSADVKERIISTRPHSILPESLSAD